MQARIPEDFERGELRFERVRREHAAELEPIQLDPRVYPTLQDPSEPPPTPADVARLVLAKDQHWRRFGFGQWVLRESAGCTVVGRGGLQYTTASGVREVEIGWVVAPARWGQGLATQLALAAIEAAFDGLGLDVVMAYTQPDNLASQRVMAKVGLAPEGDFAYDGARFLVYRRHRE